MMRKLSLLFVGVCCFVVVGACAAEERKDEESKKEEQVRKMKEMESVTITVTSSKDGTPQKAIFHAPPEAAPDKPGAPFPLLVMLHTWGGGYEQGMGVLADARQRKWIMVAPNFRGPNVNPQACASEIAVQDVLDAVDYAKKNARVDESRIFLFGLSGGGHMSLMMAAKAPNLWAAVSSWVPISDLARWHAENVASRHGYDKSMEQVCGGAPGKPKTDKEYHARSPLFFLEAAKGLPLDVNAGIHDGHSGSVPISHSLRAFNVLASANGFKDKLIQEDDIAFMTEKERIPSALQDEKEKDPERGRAVLFRRIAGPVRVTIFEGGHESENAAAFKWLARQQKGKSATWGPAPGEKSSPGDVGEARQVDK